MLMSLMSYLVISDMYCLDCVEIDTHEYISNDIDMDVMAWVYRVPGTRG